MRNPLDFEFFFSYSAFRVLHPQHYHRLWLNYFYRDLSWLLSGSWCFYQNTGNSICHGAVVDSKLRLKLFSEQKYLTSPVLSILNVSLSSFLQLLFAWSFIRRFCRLLMGLCYGLSWNLYYMGRYCTIQTSTWLTWWWRRWASKKPHYFCVLILCLYFVLKVHFFQGRQKQLDNWLSEK